MADDWRELPPAVRAMTSPPDSNNSLGKLQPPIGRGSISHCDKFKRSVTDRRDGRVAEGARLESVYTARYPGFESLSLRHTPFQRHPRTFSKIAQASVNT